MQTCIYGPADATATHCLLLQYNPDWFTFLVPADPGSPVASFRGGMGGLRTPPRIVKCKSFALSVSSKGSLYISHNGR